MIKPRSELHHYKIRILIFILLSQDVYTLRSWDQYYEQNNGDIEAIQNTNEDFSAVNPDKENTEKKVYIAGSDYKLDNIISEMLHYTCVHEIEVYFFSYKDEEFSYIRSLNSSLSVLKHLLSKYPHYFYKKLENENSYYYLNNLIIIPEDEATDDSHFSGAKLIQYCNEQDISGIDRDIKNHRNYYEFNIPNDRLYIGKDINVYVDNIMSSGLDTSNSNYYRPAQGDYSYYEFADPDGQQFKGKDINVSVFQPYTGYSNIETLISNDLQDNIYDKNDHQEENELNVSCNQNYKGKNVLEGQQSRNDLTSDVNNNNAVSEENLKVPYDGVCNQDEQVYEFNYPNNNYKVKKINVNVLVSGNDEEQNCNNANDNNNVNEENLVVPYDGLYNKDKRSYEFNFPNNNYKGKNEYVNMLESDNEEKQSRNDLINDGRDNNSVNEENLVVSYDGMYNQDERSYEFNNPNNNYKGKNKNVNMLVLGNEEQERHNDLITGANDTSNSSNEKHEFPIGVLYNQDKQGYELNYPNNKYKGVDINVDLNAADHKHNYTESSTRASYLRGYRKQFHEDDEDVANAFEPLGSRGSIWSDTDNNSADEITNPSIDIFPRYNTGSNPEIKNDAEDQYHYSDKVITDKFNSQSASTKGAQEAELVDNFNTKRLLEYPSEKYNSANIVLDDDVSAQMLPQIQETVSYKPSGQNEEISQPNKYFIDKDIRSIRTSVDRIKEPLEKATGTFMENTIPCFTASEILDMGPKADNYFEKSPQPKSNYDTPSYSKHIHRKTFQPKGQFHLDEKVDDICEINTSYPSANPSTDANVMDFANEEINSGVPHKVLHSIKSYNPFYSSKTPYTNKFLTLLKYFNTQEYTNQPQEAMLGPQLTFKPLMTGFNTYQPHIHYQPTLPYHSPLTICNEHLHTFKDIKPSIIFHDMRQYINYKKHHQNNPSQIFKYKSVPQRKLHNYDLEQTLNSYKYSSPNLKCVNEHELGSINFSQPTVSYLNPVQLTPTNYIPKIYPKSNPMLLNKLQASIMAKNNIKTKRYPCSCNYYTPIPDQISQNPIWTFADLIQQNNSTYDLPMVSHTKGFHSIPSLDKNIYIEQNPIHVASQPSYDTPASSGNDATELNQPYAIRKDNIAANSTMNLPCIHKNIQMTPKNLINGDYETRLNDGSIYTQTISYSNNNGQYTQTPSQIDCNAELNQNLDKEYPDKNEFPQKYYLGHSGSSQDKLRYPQPMAFKKFQWPKFEYTSPKIQYGEDATIAPHMAHSEPETFHMRPRYTSPSKYDNILLWSQQKPNQNVPHRNAYSQKLYKCNKYPNYFQTQTHPWFKNKSLTIHTTETPDYSTAYGFIYNGQPPITQYNSIVTNHKQKPYKSTPNICQPNHKSSNDNHPPLYQYPNNNLNNYNRVLPLPTDATSYIEPASSYKTKSYHNSIESRVPYTNYVTPCVSSEKDTSNKMLHLLGLPRNPFTNLNPLVWYGKENPIYNKQFISDTEYPESNAYNQYLYKIGNSNNPAGNYNNQNYIPKLNADTMFYNQNPSLGYEIESPAISNLIQGNKYIINRKPTTHFHTSQIDPILTPSYSTTSKPISFTSPQNPQSFDVNQDSYNPSTIQMKSPSSYNFDFGKAGLRTTPPFASLTQRYYNPTLNNGCSPSNDFVNVPWNYNSQLSFETPNLSKEQYSHLETPQSSSKFTQYPAFIYPQPLGSSYMSDTFVKYTQKSPCFPKINTLNDQLNDNVQITQSPSFKPCIFSDDKLNNVKYSIPKEQTFKYIPENQDAYRKIYQTQKSNIMTGLPSTEPYSFGYSGLPRETSINDVTLAPNFKTRAVNDLTFKSYNQNVCNTKSSLNNNPLRVKTDTIMFNRESNINIKPSNIPCLNYQAPTISTSPSIADFSSETYSASPNKDDNSCVETNINPTMYSPSALSVSSQAFNRAKHQPNWEAFSKLMNRNKYTSEASNSIPSFIPTNVPNLSINAQRHSTKSQDPYKINFKQSNTANAKCIIHNPGLNVDYNSAPFISQLYSTVMPYAQSYANQKSINRNVFDTSLDNEQLKSLRQPEYYGPENIDNIQYSPFKINPYYSNEKANGPITPYTSINQSPQYNQLNDQTPQWAINNIKDVYRNKINEEIPKILPLQYFDDNFNDPNASFSEKLKVDLGSLTVAKYDDNNRYLIKTNNPLVNLLVWKSKIKTLDGNIVIQVNDYPAMNFLPVFKGPICIDEANRLAKDIVTKMYGDPLVLKGQHSVNEPYAVILNGGCKRNVLWPAQFSCLQCC